MGAQNQRATRPKEHAPPRLCRKLPSIKISETLENQRVTPRKTLATQATSKTTIYQTFPKNSAEGRDQRSKSYVVYSSMCDMYSSSRCDEAMHVLSTLLRTVCPTYSIYSSSSERATYTSM